MNTRRDELLAALAPKVRAAARVVAYEWPGVTEADDLEQELWIRLLESSDEALEIAITQSSGGLSKAFRRMGHQIASQLRDDFEYFSGNYLYSGGEVLRMLESGYLKPRGDEDGLREYAYRKDNTNPHWSDFKTIPLARTYEDTAKLAEKEDLTAALNRIGETAPQYAAALIKRYGDLINDRADKDVLVRARRALTREMNRSFNQASREHSGPALRREQA